MNRHIWRLRAFYLRYRQQCLLLSAASLLVVLTLVIGWSADAPEPQLADRQPPATEAISSVATAPVTSDTPEPAEDSAEPSAPQAATIERITPDTPRNRIALIIDDIGNSEAAGRRAITLPADITFAVLPHTPYGRSLAELAHSAGQEVMLHAPMSNQSGMELGDGGLTPEMSETEFTETLLTALADIPHVQGMNNHTGSELTTRPKQMAWVMRELKTLGLYFVDSVTTADSVAADVATEYNVPNTRRQVFLDNSTDPDDIHFEFERLLGLAERDGQAVGIGHPYPQTLDYLEAVLPTLTERGFELVYVSELIAQKTMESVITIAP